MSGASPGADPAALSPQRQVRLLDALRALDGRQDGASYREIADALFGRRPISSSSWKTHSLRDRVIRTVRLGKRSCRATIAACYSIPIAAASRSPPLRVAISPGPEIANPRRDHPPPP